MSNVENLSPDKKLSRDEIRRRIGLAPADNQHSEPFTWPTPKPLPNGLAPVAPFSLEFLPDRLAPWVGDISNRLQCPPDYAAVAAMVALGAVIGRRHRDQAAAENRLDRDPEHLGRIYRSAGDAEVAGDGRGVEADSSPRGGGGEG